MASKIYNNKWLRMVNTSDERQIPSLPIDLSVAIATERVTRANRNKSSASARSSVQVLVALGRVIPMDSSTAAHHVWNSVTTVEVSR
jgi:hypothetical protein